MTTKVTVSPAGHTIEVLEVHGDGPPQITTLAINSPPRDFWIYGARVLTVREVVAADPDSSGA
jgi:hypothetical protein